MDIIYDVITFISKYIYRKKAKSSHFRWNHQNFTHLLKSLSIQKNLKELEIMYQNALYICIS